MAVIIFNFIWTYSIVFLILKLRMLALKYYGIFDKILGWLSFRAFARINITYLTCALEIELTLLSEFLRKTVVNIKT